MRYRTVKSSLDLLLAQVHFGSPVPSLFSGMARVFRWVSLIFVNTCCVSGVHFYQRSSLIDLFSFPRPPEVAYIGGRDIVFSFVKVCARAQLRTFPLMRSI